MSILTLFMIVGPIAILAGAAMMVSAVRSGGIGEQPKSTVMMACAFGMLLTAFSIVGQPVEAAR